MVGRSVSTMCTALLFSFVLAAEACGQSELDKGVALLDERKLDEAEAVFSKLIAADPQNHAALYHLARVHMSRDEFESAEKRLVKAVELQPENFDYVLLLGEAYGARARISNILTKGFLAPKIHSAFSKAAKLDPTSVRARVNLIDFYLEAPGFLGGSPEKAMATAKEIEALDPAQGLLEQARVYDATDRPKEAYATYREGVKRFPDDTRFYYQTGYAALNQGEPDVAFETFEALFKHKSDEYGALYQIGRAADVSGKNLERGVEAMTEYLKHDAGTDQPSKDWAHYRLGSLYEKRKDTASAKKHYQSALDVNADHKEAAEALKRLS